jgi:predicted PurR-regulated permease PerM
MTIFAFLPLVGISIVVIPAAAYLALEGQWVAAIGFLTFNMAQALLVENVVKTRLIGSQMQMHDLVIFMSIIGGLTVFGIVGLIYGPLFVALFLTLSELFEVDYKTRLAHHDDHPRMTVPPPA